MTETASASPVPAAQAEKVRAALLRYRVLAWITGIWLLLLVAEIVLKVMSGEIFGLDTGIYAIAEDNPALSAMKIVPVVHGWVYFVYLIMTVDLAIKVRWSPVKTIITAIAGTIPFLSFWFEHIRAKEVKEQFGL
ncbi:hypothetical protein ACN93_16615 [Gordonia paraffinivorans]|uniref:DUF3817 domain-containing protein n=1 Tax=Gordonia paraffinivorans TaxID=175628 RepID=UPI000D6082AA|nr:DUF3817 domain-containing protein [Gordonia paraffinivorans]PWD42003.1 hypothetical protein ACN93_16615 [Gordonia paraffinivorans]